MLRIAMIKQFHELYDVTFVGEPGARRLAAFVQATSDIPLPWLKCGFDRCYGLYGVDQMRKVPMPADVRMYARELAGPVIVDDKRTTGNRLDYIAWPDIGMAIRILGTGSAVTRPLTGSPLSTVTELPQLNDPTRKALGFAPLGDVVRELLSDVTPDPRGVEPDESRASSYGVTPED